MKPLAYIPFLTPCFITMITKVAASFLNPPAFSNNPVKVVVKNTAESCISNTQINANCNSDNEENLLVQNNGFRLACLIVGTACKLNGNPDPTVRGNYLNVMKVKLCNSISFSSADTRYLLPVHDGIHALIAEIIANDP